MTLDKIKITKIKTVKGKDKNLLCTSFFRMKNSYKDSNIYMEGLENQLAFFDRFAGKYDITYRIYFDESAEDDKNWLRTYDLLLQKDYIELSKYEYKPVKKGKYHDGIFGMFVRFLPMFQTKSEKDWKVYSSVDLDWEMSSDFLNRIQYFYKSSENFFVKLPKCYHLRPWLEFLPYTKKYSLVVNGSGFSSKISFKKNILYNFLNDILQKGEKYQNFVNLNKMNSKNFLGNIGNDLFVYGMDEYFLSTIILEILEKNKEKILIHHWFITYVGLLINIRKLNNNFKNISEEKKRLWTKLLKKVLLNNYRKNKNFYQNYTFLQISLHCDMNKQFKTYCKRLAYEMRYIFDRKRNLEYGIPDYFKECFYTRNYNTYSVFNFN